MPKAPIKAKRNTRHLRQMMAICLWALSSQDKLLRLDKFAQMQACSSRT